MERVVSINLNGNSYQLEEPAYDALRAYLARAESALADNPDKAEIVRDLEQAVADKCAAYLSAHKSVVSADEMARVLDEMGPVEADAREEPRKQAGPTEPPQKRLYRIRDGAWIAGICSGLSAYLDIDVAIVRLIAVVLGVITGGWAFLIYIIAMFIIPSAQTSAEWAAAHGMPFNTQEIIDRAKREYRAMADDMSRSWRSSMRAQRRAWRHQAWSGWDAGPPPTAPATPVGYLTRILSGVMGFILSLVGAALLIAFLIALFALLNTGAVLGWTPPTDVPVWLAIVVLCIAYGAIATPLAYLRRSAYAAASGYRLHAGAADGFITFVAIVAGAALAYQFVPEFRVWVETLPDTLRALGDRLEAL
jgi:phage shock protein PspC (stress-responsive transcriptional regulator)